MNRKRLFIFICENMGIGGIQTYIYNATKFLNEKGESVIVAHKSSYPFEGSYRKLINNVPNATVELSALKKDFSNIICNYNTNHVTIITFYMRDFAMAESIKSENKSVIIDSFYYVPNFKGPYYYLEEIFNGKRKERICQRMGEIVRKMNDANVIRYFAAPHIEKMTTQYKFHPHSFNDVGVPPTNPSYKFDETKRREVYCQNEKKILTVSRFDFPHKGFIIGLIREFKNLKGKYPQLTMMFVGSGSGLVQMKQEIAQLPEDIQSSISIVDAVPFEELSKYYSEAYINVSVAGCCVLGTMQGTLSMPARHFTYSCEVYGFMPKSRQLTTSDTPGESLEKYISEALSMSEEEYVAACRSGFEAYQIETRKTSLLDTNRTNEPILTKKDIRYIYRTVRWITFLIPRKREWEAIKKEGVFKPIKRRLKRVLLHKRV